MGKTLIAFLCKKIQDGTRDFAKQIAKETDFDVMVVEDTDFAFAYTIHGSFRNVHDFQINDKSCHEAGFHGCNITGKETHIQKQVIAYDKLLYYLLEYLPDHSRPNYDFVWVFEEDVFIPSVDVLIKLHRHYGENYDLVTANNHLKTDNVMDWHWPHITKSIEPPYYYSMVSAAGFSREMLECVNQYRKTNGHLFYIEAMFNTLAMQNNLKVWAAFPLKSCVWKGEWGYDQFLKLPNNVFHPVKDIHNHQKYRHGIESLRQVGYKPICVLPEFLRK